MKIKPINDNIVVKVKKEQNKITDSGIEIITKQKESTNQGIVVATGRGRTLQNGNILPLSVKEGDTVLFYEYAGTKIKTDDEEYLLMKENDILATL